MEYWKETPINPPIGDPTEPPVDPPTENPMTMLRDIAANDTFLYFGDEQEKRIYARYLSYKAIQAAYVFHTGTAGSRSDSGSDPGTGPDTGSGTGWTWARYCRRFAEDQPLRQMARSVIDDTLCAYAKDGFPFQAAETQQGKAVAFQQANVLYAQAVLMRQRPTISLYDTETEEKRMIHYFFLLVEIAYYAYQLRQGRRYTWETYLMELQTTPAMRQVLCLVFYDALLNVDFTAGWRQVLAESHRLFP